MFSINPSISARMRAVIGNFGGAFDAVETFE
jgi:hypothetical protein